MVCCCSLAGTDACKNCNAVDYGKINSGGIINTDDFILTEKCSETIFTNEQFEKIFMSKNLDEVYVIYYKGKKLEDYSYRAEYKQLKTAKSTVTRLSKSSKNKDDYEIRIFVDSGRKVDLK